MKDRFSQLDALRGLAALSVIMMHLFPPSLGVFYDTLQKAYSPLSIFFKGREAVDFFFILSGFVLSLPLLDKKQPPYPNYLGSKGKVDMPTWFMEELKEHYHDWKVNRFKVGDTWQGEDRHYVFHGGLGKPHYHTYPTCWWKKFIKRHRLKYIRLHDLRHTSATLLIEEGVSLKAIQKRLRHSQFSTTADLYAHVTKKLSQDTAEKFNKFVPKDTQKNSVNNSSTTG